MGSNTKGAHARTTAQVEHLERRTLLSGQLVKDVNPQPSAEYVPAPLTRAGGVAYFAGNDGVNGLELWKTDGTAAGTVMVKDVRPGAASSSPTLITNVDGVVYFVADDGTHGAELWRSDGTAAGTVLVKDIHPLATAAGPSALTAVGGAVYFYADDGVHGLELWRSDGTEAGTAFIADLRPGAEGQSPYPFAPIAATSAGTVFFIGRDGTDTRGGLWKTDGTAAGTSLVKSLASTTSGDVWQIYAAGPRVFFYDVRRGVWASDGTTAGTVLVQSTSVAAYQTQIPEQLGVDDGSFYYVRQEPGAGAGVYRVPAGTATARLITEAGTAARFTDVSDLALVDGTLYFAATGTSVGREVHAAAAGATSAAVLKDVSPGAAGGVDNLTAVGASLYFTAGSAASGYALWTSDGTPAGTSAVSPVAAGAARPPSNPLALGPALLFVNDDGVDGPELWRSDGTATGTGLVKAIYPGTAASSPTFWGALGGAMLFTVKDTSGGEDLWRTDGTASGTTLLYDAWPGDALRPRNAGVVGNAAYFAAGDAATGLELWVTDGTPDGTRLVRDINPGATGAAPTGFVQADGWTYFVANDGVHGYELWRTDGTTDGTTLVADVRAGVDDGLTNLTSAYPLVVMDGVVYFAATGANGYFMGELWRSDGTPAGTYRLQDSIATGVKTNADSLFTDGRRLLFKRGTVLWTSDGTAAGTVRVKDMASAGYVPRNSFIAMDGWIYFPINDGVVPGLWRTDGTEAGTTRAAPVSSIVSNGAAAVMNGRLYFRSFKGVPYGEGPALWTSDGTADGTVMVARVTQLDNNVTRSSPLLPVNGRLFFVNKTTQLGGSGYELWSTDGTPEGTGIVQDLNPGAADGVTGPIWPLNGAVYIAGNDGVTGFEPYRFADTFAPRVLAGQFDYQARHAVRIAFSENVAASVGSADVVLTNLTTGATVPAASVARSYDPATHTATLTFPDLPGGALPDGEYRLTLHAGSVADAAGNPMTTDFTFDFFTLAGDANRDRTVDFTDLLALAKNYNQSAKTWADGDFTGDGVVNFSDLLILAKAYNKTLPAPAPVATATATAAPQTAASVLRDGDDGKARPPFSTTRVTQPPTPPKPTPVKPKPVQRPKTR